MVAMVHGSVQGKEWGVGDFEITPFGTEVHPKELPL